MHYVIKTFFCWIFFHLGKVFQISRWSKFMQGSLSLCCCFTLKSVQLVEEYKKGAQPWVLEILQISNIDSWFSHDFNRCFQQRRSARRGSFPFTEHLKNGKSGFSFFWEKCSIFQVVQEVFSDHLFVTAWSWNQSTKFEEDKKNDSILEFWRFCNFYHRSLNATWFQ